MAPKDGGRVMGEWVIDCGFEEEPALCSRDEEQETKV